MRYVFIRSEHDLQLVPQQILDFSKILQLTIIIPNTFNKLTIWYKTWIKFSHCINMCVYQKGLYNIKQVW
jgi:hypothetical protein